MTKGTLLRVNRGCCTEVRPSVLSYGHGGTLDVGSVVMYLGETFDDDANCTNDFEGDKMLVLLTDVGIRYVYAFGAINLQGFVQI